jgi:hypothetical protein
MAGYSGRPLAAKLGIKPGWRVLVRSPPDGYRELLEGLPADVALGADLAGEVEMIHLFTRGRDELAAALPVLLPRIRQEGTIWVSWPKRSSGVPTDVTENAVRELALPLGLVDVKVCAVDDTWSGLKLVIRKEKRRPSAPDLLDLGAPEARPTKLPISEALAQERTEP